MNSASPYRRKLANGLANVAVFLLPQRRIQWAQAFQAELATIENDRLAVNWAMGYLLVALKERGKSMINLNNNISRTVLIPEMLLCFGPITLAWLFLFTNFENGLLANAIGALLAFFQGEAVSASEVIGLTTLSLFGVTIGLLGPVGLFLSYRVIVQKRSIQHGLLKHSLVYGPMVLGFSLIVAALILRGWGSNRAGFAGLLFLIVVLPLIGGVHLLQLGSQIDNNEATA